MRVIGLFRVSTERQEAQGTSLESQAQAFEQQALRNGWTVAARFRGCESATQASSDRRVLQQVLTCLREQDVQGLWVYEQSRLTRGDELEVALLLRELRERRLKIIVNGVVRDLDSIDERFMIGIQSLVDRAESERIKERMTRGKRTRAAQGKKTCGGAPHGYMNPPPGDPGRGTLRVVPAEAAVVRQIFAWRVAGAGAQTIVKRLNQAGATPPRGARWAKTTVNRILQNVAYIGTSASGVWLGKRGGTFRLDMKNPRAILVENAHEPIIDRETWDAVHGRPRVPRTCRPKLLTGLLTLNGRPGHSDTNGGVGYYRGPRRVRGLPWIDAKEADEAAWSAFVSLGSSEALVERLMAEAANPKQRLDAEREADFLVEQIDKISRRLDRLVTMRADGEIDREEFQRRRDEAARQIEGLRAGLAQQRAVLSAGDATWAPRVVRAIRAVLGGQTGLSDAQKRVLLRSVVRSVEIEAVPTGRSYARDARGRVLPGRTPRWAVERVTLRLALPPEAPSEERGASRAGHKVLTPSCSGPRAPARA